MARKQLCIFVASCLVASFSLASVARAQPTRPAGTISNALPSSFQLDENQLNILKQKWHERGRPRVQISTVSYNQRGEVLQAECVPCSTFESVVKSDFQAAGIKIENSVARSRLVAERIAALKGQPDKVNKFARAELGERPGLLLITTMSHQGGGKVVPNVSMLDCDEGTEVFSLALGAMDDADARKFANATMKELVTRWVVSERELNISVVGAFSHDIAQRVGTALKNKSGVTSVQVKFNNLAGGAAASFSVFFKGDQGDVVESFRECVRDAAHGAEKFACRVTGDRPNNVEVTVFKPLDAAWYRMTQRGSNDQIELRKTVQDCLDRLSGIDIGVVVTNGPPQALSDSALADSSRFASFDNTTLAAQLGQHLGTVGFENIRDPGTLSANDQQLAAALARDSGAALAPGFADAFNGLGLVVHCQASPQANGTGFSYLVRMLHTRSGQVLASTTWPDPNIWRYDIDEGFDPTETENASRYIVGQLMQAARDWLQRRADRRVQELVLVNIDKNAAPMLADISACLKKVPGLVDLKEAASAETSNGWRFSYEGEDDINKVLRERLTADPFKFFLLSSGDGLAVFSAIQPPPAPIIAPVAQESPPDPAPFPAVSPLNNRRALVIGINEYPGDNDLRYCVKDANLLAQELVQRCGYPQENVTLMTSDKPGVFKPTEANIVSALRTLLANARKGDQVLIYFSGHGAPLYADDQKTILDAALCAMDVEARRGEEPKGLVPIGLLRDVVRKTVDGEAIFILDACHSGTDAEAFAAAPNAKIGTHRDFAKGSSAEGMVTLAACRVSEKAIETQDIEHGYFTKFVVDGLTRADAIGIGNNNGEVDLAELYTYTFSRVRQATSGRQNPVLKASISGIPVLVRRR